MADAISIQELIDARTDAKTLEEAVNGDAVTTVLSRLGESYPTLANALSQIDGKLDSADAHIKQSITDLFENGGLPATPFATKALMTASPLVDGKYAMVTNDAVNNGLYVKTAGAWVKSNYDPVSQSKTYADTKILYSLDTKDIDLTDVNHSKHKFALYTKTTEPSEYVWANRNASDLMAEVVLTGKSISVTANTVSTSVIYFTNGNTPAVGSDPISSNLFIVPVNTTQTINIPLGATKAFVAMQLSTTNKKPKSFILQGLSSANHTAVDISALSTLNVAMYKDPEHKYIWRRGSAGDSTVQFPVVEGMLLRVSANSSATCVVYFTNGTEMQDNEPANLSLLNIIPVGATQVIAVPVGMTRAYISIKVSIEVKTPTKVELGHNFLVNNLNTNASTAPLSAAMGKKLYDMVTEGVSTKPQGVVEVKAKKTTVFATHKSFILKDELIGGVSTLCISDDLGKTWSYVTNTIGKITMFHIFVDGSIMLCGFNKVYHLSDDYTQLIESTVLDHDGSVFIPENRVNFFTLVDGNTTQYVDDTEVYVWGEYILTGNNARLWYTADRGKTIKCAIKEGTTLVDGVARSIRHFHTTTQRKKDEKFYITTGDAGAECQIIRGAYDVASDTWSWKFIAGGDSYKFGDIFFDEHYCYVMTDFTLASLKSQIGLYRVAVENLNDFSKYRLIFSPKLADLGIASFSRYTEDRSGVKLVMGDNNAQGKIWVADSNANFEFYTFDTPLSFMCRVGSNDLGDSYGLDVFERPYSNDNLFINKGSYNMTEVIRDMGFRDFMRKEVLVRDTYLN